MVHRTRIVSAAATLSLLLFAAAPSLGTERADNRWAAEILDGVGPIASVNGMVTRRASRWQHIFSGAQHSHLLKMRSDSITEKPGNRIAAAFAKFRTRLTRSTYCKKPGLGAATPWFDIVDPEYRWYEEDTRVRRS